MRTGFILQEALTRYNLNAVPSWSSSYGTHVMRGEGPETVVDAQRNIVWTSVIGDCWRIPHDNRINFSFRGPDSDFGAIVRVRNFVSGFHRQEHSDAPKGEHFNVWDWFDTGISAYWYPGKIVAAAPLASPTWSPQFKEGYGNGYPLSSMIAPWRRIMYVVPLRKCLELTAIVTCKASQLCLSMTTKCVRMILPIKTFVLSFPRHMGRSFKNPWMRSFGELSDIT
jgi:hypothetical protein